MSTALTGAVSGLTSLLIFRLALGFGQGATFPTATRAMATWTPKRNWAFAQGLVHSFARIGNALTPALMILVMIFVSWRGAFVMGLVHGSYCLGCCWFLMALLFFGGIMNLFWIVGLAVFVLLEKTLPLGHWFGRLAGIAAISWGVALLVRAAGGT